MLIYFYTGVYMPSFVSTFKLALSFCKVSWNNIWWLSFYVSVHPGSGNSIVLKETKNNLELRSFLQWFSIKCDLIIVNRSSWLVSANISRARSVALDQICRWSFDHSSLPQLRRRDTGHWRAAHQFLHWASGLCRSVSPSFYEVWSGRQPPWHSRLVNKEVCQLLWCLKAFYCDCWVFLVSPMFRKSSQCATLTPFMEAWTLGDLFVFPSSLLHVSFYWSYVFGDLQLRKLLAYN